MIRVQGNCACPLSDSGITLTNSPVCSGYAIFMVLLEAYIRGRCDIATPCKRVDSVDTLENVYDFIVVGAGSAGSIVASRLSEDGNNSVLLLEAGGQEPIGARIPSFYRTFWSNEEVDWRYRTVPENYCLDQKGQGCMWPRGKVVGGSSVLNGMMYHRGHPADYEDWVEAGAEGWSWEENQKYFAMTEGNRQIGSLVSAECHSSTGPLPVQQFSYQPPFLSELLKAIGDAGLPVVQDMNNPKTPEGFMVAQTMSNDGQRYTTARAYLKPKSERPNLSLKTKALVSKVIVENSVTKGVIYLDEDGHEHTVRASKEVILSAGALNTPQILLLSGIGPRETLNKHGIPVVTDLPVGRNLRNHMGMTLQFVIPTEKNTRVLNWDVLTEYLLERSGPMAATGITQLTGLLYSSLANQSRSQPDIQFFFNGFYAECSKTGKIGDISPGCMNGQNISANAALLLPRSVGYLTLNSTDPRDPPLFYPEYFTKKDDMIMLIDGARYLKAIFETHIMKVKYGLKLDPAYTKVCKLHGKEWTDSWIECMARQHTDPQNHQLGTAAIGKVVDTQLNVYGVTGLRVIDASAMPTQPTGNPQGAIMMVAERGAVLIKEKWQ